MTETPVVDRLARPLRDLRISVTDRCNFRCGYCMPRDVFHEGYAFMPRAEVLTFEEIERIARLAVQRLGARKLRLTGGEPLLRRDLPRLVEKLARIDGVEDIALTTNGLLLREHAAGLAAAGLCRVTVSLDALDAKTFGAMAGLPGDASEALARVLGGIEAADAAGLRPIKINCVVQRGLNEHAVEDLARHFRGSGRSVRFIEFMDVGTLNAWTAERVVPASEIRAALERIAPLVPVVDEALQPGQVAERYCFTDDQSEVGIIASVTRPFCGTCTRARLAADGRFLRCLFATEGADLRGLLRGGASDDALASVLIDQWRTREDRYSELRAGLTPSATKRRLEMYQVGG